MKTVIYFFTAEMGMMGLASATVPATNLRICSCCMEASCGFTRSTCVRVCKDVCMYVGVMRDGVWGAKGAVRPSLVESELDLSSPCSVV